MVVGCLGEWWLCGWLLCIVFSGAKGCFDSLNDGSLMVVLV